MLNVFEGFAGIGSVSTALENMGVEHKLVGFSEIDHFAIKAFCALHNVTEDINSGDVTSIVHSTLPRIDLYSFGFPCQDISKNGDNGGTYWTCENCYNEYNPITVPWRERGHCPICLESSYLRTRSSLVTEALSMIRFSKPKYLIMENVKNLVSSRYRDSFENVLSELDEYGYNNYWTVLNACDYGIPQNRERVFAVSIRKDVDRCGYTFPEPVHNRRNLLEYLETDVTENMYLPSRTMKLLAYDGVALEPSDVPIEPRFIVKNATKIGHLTAYMGDSISFSFPNSNTRRGRVIKGMVGTLDTVCTQAVLTPYNRLRRLTAIECWRLMGHMDSDYYKVKAVGVSESQMLKLAGNSIVIPVLEAILENLLLKEVIE